MVGVIIAVVVLLVIFVAVVIYYRTRGDGRSTGGNQHAFTTPPDRTGTLVMNSAYGGPTESTIDSPKHETFANGSKPFKTPSVRSTGSAYELPDVNNVTASYD
jgi:hypothetical protein